ncbi:type IV pilus modification protein PilV [Paraferrimonas sedimenticola]|uniref:Type IV pilus modification protein PilV n=1 Tax=Paraferrimonas sedimenticola TaxID=375674 RepID=A0AA37RXC9_9GAMM|nr:type IV pilus modification protein PilV [Paraferrimonas sedimenticola]
MEVLVTLIILVVGLLGVFTLHSVAKRTNFEAYQYTQATYLANDLINRMRLNRGELAQYAGTYTGNLSVPSTVCESGTATVTCDDSEMRSWDLYDWEQLMMGASVTEGGAKLSALTSPTACVGVQASGDVTVVISWQGMSETEDEAKSEEDDAAATATDTLISDCGTAGKKRRHVVIASVVM